MSLVACNCLSFYKQKMSVPSVYVYVAIHLVAEGLGADSELGLTKLISPSALEPPIYLSWLAGTLFAIHQICVFLTFCVGMS